MASTRGSAPTRLVGLGPVPATQATLAEFGDPDQVAHALAPELAAVHARWVALTLVRTGPLLGALWITALPASPLSTPPTAALWPLAVVVAAWPLGRPPRCLVWSCSSEYRPPRWPWERPTGPPGLCPPAGPRLAPTAAAAAALAGMTVGLALLGMLSAQAFISPRQLAWAPATAAAIASLTRLALAGRATRRCLASRSIVPSG
jgi:hypothetical protein